MVLTITLNSLLERRYIVDNFKSGNEHRNVKVELKAGGKGINVSRQLNRLNCENLAFTFLGGTNGKTLRDVLVQENLNFTSLKSKSETRDCAVIVNNSENNVSSFFSPDPVVTKSESEEFIIKLDKMIQNCEIVVFSGSSPSEETNSIIPIGIELANKYDKISVCDTYGVHLQESINKSPTIIHNNIEESEKSLNISLKTEKEKIQYLEHLYDKGIKQVYLTDDNQPVYAANFDYHFKILPPKIKTINSKGSGDCFVAGIVYAWHNNFTFDEGLEIAVSLGALNASRFDVCNINLNEIEEVKNYVEISTVGKKMKTIDVTPR